MRDFPILFSAGRPWLVLRFSLIDFSARNAETFVERFGHAIGTPTADDLLAINVNVNWVLIRLNVVAGYDFNVSAFIRVRLQVARTGLSLNPCHGGLRCFRAILA
jgi:hypothetical protein